VTTQLDLFGEARVEVEEPEPRTTVRVGRRAARLNLGKKRREALEKLLPLLKELEGKTVYIGTYGGSRSHFWLRNLKLERLAVEGLLGWGSNNKLPSVIVLWGSRGACVRIFTDQVVNLRQQEYQGYTLWLLDFWNGHGEHPVNPYRPTGYVSLDIVRFKD